MVRQTSIDSYNIIKENGLLDGLLFTVYEAIYFGGPMTQMETCRAINSPKTQDRSLMPRFAQLKNMGAINEVGKKICSITGREVLLWDVTKNIPSKPEIENKGFYTILNPLTQTFFLFKSEEQAESYKRKQNILSPVYKMKDMRK